MATTGRIAGWAETAFDFLFAGVTAFWGVLFLLDKLGYMLLGPPLVILLMALWCPLFWWKYWRAKVDGVRGAWFFLACSVVLTGLTVFAAFVILFRIARA